MRDVEVELLDLVEHPVFVLEPDAAGVPRYAAFNEHACRLLGLTRADILGRTAAELYPGRLGHIAFERHVEVMRSATSAAYEILLPLADTQRLVRTTLRPVCDDTGAVLRIVGSSTDVSSDAAFQQIQGDKAGLSREIEEYIALAAHDLRAPMRNVSLIAEMMRDDFEDLGDGKLDLIDALDDIGKKASRLIADVLSHAEAATPVRETVEYDFAELMQEVSTLLDPMGRCVIRHSVGRVEGDRTAMQIILRNLIDNAMKVTLPQTDDDPQLELVIDLEDQQDGYVEIAVTDNGQGFSDPALLFLDTGKLRVDSGFGLLGVRRLIHARRGTVRAANRTDARGAVIAFTLPGRVVGGASPVAASA